MRGLNAPPRSIFAPAFATPSAACMICFSDSTEHGPAMTMNSSPPISSPFTRTCVRPARNSLLTNLYGAEMRTTFSTCGMASTRFQARGHIAHSDDSDHDALLSLDGMHFVAEIFDLVANFIDFLRVACSFMEMIMAVLFLVSCFCPFSVRFPRDEMFSAPKQKTHSVASGLEFLLCCCDYKFAPRLLFRWHPKSKPIRVGASVHEGSVLRRADSRKLFFGCSAQKRRRG